MKLPLKRAVESITDEGYAFLWRGLRFRKPFTGKSAMQKRLEERLNNYYLRPYCSEKLVFYDNKLCLLKKGVMTDTVNSLFYAEFLSEDEKEIDRYFEIMLAMEFIDNFFANRSPQSDMREEAKKFRKALAHPRNSTNSQLAFFAKET